MSGRCSECDDLFKQGKPFYGLNWFAAIYLGPTKNKGRRADLCSLACLQAYVSKMEEE